MSSTVSEEHAHPDYRALYARIWQATGRTQIVLIILSLSVAALAAAPLYFQKELVNGLAYDMSERELFILGAQYAVTSLIAIVLKAFLKYRSAVLGEETVRRIRERIFAQYAGERETGSPPTTPAGTLVSTMTAEAEVVGHFVGNAIALPLVQIGTLLSVLLYLSIDEPVLGLFVCLIVAPQFLVVSQIQKPINRLVRTRLKLLRLGANRAVDPDHPREEVFAAFRGVFEARQRINFLKAILKSILGTIVSLGTVGILVIGGWLVLQGRSDVGTVVAALSGLARVASPWNDLVAFYRTLNSIHVQFNFLEGAMRSK